MTRGRIVENVDAEHFAYLACVPGLEVHADPDVTWKVSPATAWANCGVRLRFEPGTARERIDEILARYRENERGAGFWVSPSAQPDSLPALLKSRALRCRKHFPAMLCDLAGLPVVEPPLLTVDLSVVTDYTVFQRDPHPGVGRLTTPIRRFNFEVKRCLASMQPRRCWEFLASHEGRPVGACTLFLGERHAGLHDVAVLERFRNRGIGRALVSFACCFAKERGAETVTLIATNEGYRMYEHAGFREICRIGFWYTAKP